MDKTTTDTYIGNVFTDMIPYENRVRLETPITGDQHLTKAYLMMCQENSIHDSIQFAWLGEAMSKYRTSGIYNYFTKLYSLKGANDATQATSTSQPYLSGNIAPNEKCAMGNPNGGTTAIDFSGISYTAIDPWSVTQVLEWNDSTSTYVETLCNGTNSVIGLKFNNNYRLYFTNSTGTQTTITLGLLPAGKYIGKTVVITVVANGSGNISFYFNGSLKQTLAANGNTSFAPIHTNYTNTIFAFCGRQYGIIIRSQALTAAQVLAEYNYFRALYPEIPSVVIGTQTWGTSNCEMVCTPQGNLINEIQGDANVEKLINGTFDTDTNWSKPGSSGWTISGGVASNDGTGVGTSYSQQCGIAVGKWYKITYTVLNYVSGSVNLSPGGYNFTTVRSSNGTWTEYIFTANTSATTGLYIHTATTFVGSVDNVSCQEVGWSDSQNLYDSIYAATSGTVEQKTYAAVKAAAMWSHYNNDVALGAVYGKLYNWFAVKLLQMDIDYYNTANPTTPWGWKVPTAANFTALSTILGGDTVSGGKLKKDGLTYWTTPNTGADNSSGFSAIPSGSRSGTNGSFSAINIRSSFHSSDTGTFSQMLELRNDASTSTVWTGQSPGVGRAIRLIKV